MYNTSYLMYLSPFFQIALTTSPSIGGIVGGTVAGVLIVILAVILTVIVIIFLFRLACIIIFEVFTSFFLVKLCVLINYNYINAGCVVGLLMMSML